LGSKRPATSTLLEQIDLAPGQRVLDSGDRLRCQAPGARVESSALLASGYSEEDTRSILGESVLRVLETNESVANGLQGGKK
jgi:hypothetical protein